MDPGIVVRNTDPSADQAEPSIEYETGQSLKWCRTCHLYRSTGTKHCRYDCIPESRCPKTLVHLTSQHQHGHRPSCEKDILCPS